MECIGNGVRPDNKLPVNAIGQAADNKLPVNAIKQAADDKLPVDAIGQDADDRLPVNAIGQAADDKLPVNAIGQATDNKLPVNAIGQAAFTLIEVLVVVAILAILAAIVVPRIMDRPDEARAVAAKADIGAIVQSLKLYRLDNGFYPSTDQGLGALVQRPSSPPVPPNWKQGGYLERLPKDPWGGDYQYLNPGVHGEVDVFSLGADHAAGGEGNGADIGNWN